MWCTRWYLPLVLLPLPIAPPYFLALFLFSTTLHAKPCFYCIILITSLFVASCYWPAVPLDTALSTPWSDNITTFADALISRMPNLPLDMVPATIQVADRCWCDFSEGFFEPFNTTQWELNSVEGLKRQLERQMRERGMVVTAGDVKADITRAANGTASETSSTLQSEIESKYRALSSSLKNMWGKLDLTSHTPSLNSTPSEEEILQETPSPQPETSTPHSLSSTSQNIPSPSSLWKEYDLRYYGFDMIVDLRWAS